MSILHHMRFTNHLFSLPNAHSPYVPYEDVKISHSGLAGKNCFFSSPSTTPTRAYTGETTPSSLAHLFPLCFFLYGSTDDSHFNTLPSLDERTTLTRRESFGTSCNVLSIEKQELNLEAVGKPLTTHSCSK